MPFTLYPADVGHENISITFAFYALVTLDILVKAIEKANPSEKNAAIFSYFVMDAVHEDKRTYRIQRA